MSEHESNPKVENSAVTRLDSLLPASASRIEAVSSAVDYLLPPSSAAARGQAFVAEGGEVVNIFRADVGNNERQISRYTNAYVSGLDGVQAKTAYRSSYVLSMDGDEQRLRKTEWLGKPAGAEPLSATEAEANRLLVDLANLKPYDDGPNGGIEKASPEEALDPEMPVRQ